MVYASAALTARVLTGSAAPQGLEYALLLLASAHVGATEASAAA
jgi:hypothetical protein